MKSFAGFLSVVTLILLSGTVPSPAQVVVNEKDLNADKQLKYIQLMYYVDRANFKPVFAIDYGLIEPEYTDILEPERDYKQTIRVNGETVSDRVTVVWLLNKMDQAGWEYMGDVVYLPLKMMDDWHVFTLKRKDSSL